MTTADVEDVEDVWRQSAPRVLGALARRTGDFDAAEDAVQEALLAASQQWTDGQVPDDPGAWLIRVASRRLVDRWRSDRSRADREELVARLAPADALHAPAADDTVGALGDDPDDSFTLLVLCCHPLLARPTQVALTLRAVGGLSTAQIARAFLVPEATMAQRITRAKARLRDLDAPFALPAADEVPARVAAVTQVLYLVFTEGHTATTGAGLTDTSLADEAIRLARRLHHLVPDDGEVTGLLALMLLTDARRSARTGPDGALVPLAEQDRALWDQALIEEGTTLVEAALPAGRVGPLQLQAAIAAVHAEAASPEATDWAQIDVLFGMLAAIVPGPVVTLNHAVAVAEVAGPAAALAMVEPLVEDPGLCRTHRIHAVRAHLLERLGRVDEAGDAYVLAARLATSIPEQRYLNGRATGARRPADQDD